MTLRPIQVRFTAALLAQGYMCEHMLE